MSNGYELADGSLSMDYEVGDEFLRTQNSFASGNAGELRVLTKDEGTECSLFYSEDGKEYAAQWDKLIPTPETKRKAKARKAKFAINAGDYIDSREFTREECERFCELAVERGFGRGEWMAYHGTRYFKLGVSSNYKEIKWGSMASGEISYGYSAKNNITTQFREFLDKEKDMSKFTKDDFEDGQKIYLEDGAKTIGGILITSYQPLYVCGDEAIARLPDGGFATLQFSTLSNNLKTPSGKKVIRIIDRDGTVLFEREPEKVKLELEVTPEQAEAIRKQLNQ